MIIILGSGSCLPKKLIKNDELPKELETSDEWITQRTGIKQRYIASDDEDVVTMGADAAKNALKKANLQASDIDMIIVATTTPNKIFPSCAAQIQAKLGCINAFAFDLQAVCSGFLYSYYTSVRMMQADIKLNNILVIGAEKMSQILNWEDRSSCVLFGDGAGAIIVSKSIDKQRGFIDGILKTDGTLSNILYAERNSCLVQDGKRVFIAATGNLERVIKEICAQNNINLSDIKYFLIHQANIRILQFLANKLEIEEERMLSTMHLYANTSAASIPLLINYYDNQNQFQPGDLILMAAVGGGMTWGASLLRW